MKNRVRQSSPLESQLSMRRFLIREVRTLHYGYSGFNNSELLKSIHILKESKERDEGRSSRKEETLTTNPGRVKQGTIANESRVNLSAEVLIQSEHEQEGVMPLDSFPPGLEEGSGIVVSSNTKGQGALSKAFSSLSDSMPSS